MISVVIPISNMHELTDGCIDTLLEHATDSIEVIVIDNASVTPYEREGIKTIRNERNIGFWPSILQGMEAANNDQVLCMHNDVFIWEQGWNNRLLTHYALDHKLNIIGLFGGSGVGIDGGRGNPMGNMLGRKYGMNIKDHGLLLEGSYPGVVFDSLAMCFNKPYFYTLKPEELPMHHWCDRLITLRSVFEGYHNLICGIPFDHGGSLSAGQITPVNDPKEDFCREKGLSFRENWDFTLYMYGREMFEKEFRYVLGDAKQLWVNEYYQYMTRG